MRKFYFCDPDNILPFSMLRWEGPGNYGTRENITFGVCLIEKDSGREKAWADTPEEAAGVYVNYGVGHESP
jgi:hypothetical protein